MALQPFTRKQAELKVGAYCENKIPMQLQNKIRIYFKIRGNNITIFESRPFYDNPSEWTHMKIAQLRYDNNANEWSLYCADRNEKWHSHIDSEPTKNIEELLKDIEEDPTGIFWG